MWKILKVLERSFLRVFVSTVLSALRLGAIYTFPDKEWKFSKMWKLLKILRVFVLTVLSALCLGAIYTFPGKESKFSKMWKILKILRVFVSTVLWALCLGLGAVYTFSGKEWKFAKTWKIVKMLKQITVILFLVNFSYRLGDVSKFKFNIVVHFRYRTHTSIILVIEKDISFSAGSSTGRQGFIVYIFLLFPFFLIMLVASCLI